MKEYREGSESTFIHLQKERKVDDLIKAVQHKPVEFFQTSIFSWMLEYYDNEASRSGSADLSFPIIITKDFIDWQNRYIILDGFHRYVKALYLGKLFIKVKEISKQELNKIKEV